MVMIPRAELSRPVHVPNFVADPDQGHVLVRHGAEADWRRGPGGAQVEDAGLALGSDLVTRPAQETAVVQRSPRDVVHGSHAAIHSDNEEIEEVSSQYKERE